MQKPNFLLLTALSLALTAPLVPAFAQFAPGHGQHSGRLKKLAAELNLTDAQKAQLQPILQSARQQAQAIKADTTLTTDARKAKLKDLQKSTRTQMMAILTPAQRVQLKAINKAKREAKKTANRFAPHPNFGEPEKRRFPISSLPNLAPQNWGGGLLQPMLRADRLQQAVRRFVHERIDFGKAAGQVRVGNFAHGASRRVLQKWPDNGAAFAESLHMG